jgi:hypothetical protein
MVKANNVGGLSKARLDRMHDVMAGHVKAGDMPGMVTLVSRGGETHVDAIGQIAFGGAPMDGGYGTSWYSDPKENLTGILLTQRMMDSPQPPRALVDFWTLAYQAIDD